MTLSRETPKGSDSVAAIQQLLVELGFHPGKCDHEFGEMTERAVIRFQEFAGIYADGTVGPITMTALENAYQHHVIELNSPGTAAAGNGLLPFTKVPADSYPGGNPQLFLRADAAADFRLLKQKVNDLGGLLTSSAGRRALSAHVSYNRASASFHYLGLAFDLFFWSGLHHLDKDPYLVQLADQAKRRLRVWVRCDPARVEPVTLEHVLVAGDPGFSQRKTITGPFADLTALAEKHHFFPIPYRRRFEQNGDTLASEWWHFQYHKGLIPGSSTFGGELRKVYPLDQLEGTPPWRYRDRIFHQHRF
ncbi:peptidoglycan-binding domain-containing protein [Acanthopleuribacter pedis]|uniref:Peptidoglycan-binding protein n=1 Tax=Acanthopleuribacter pedis TaxID=442870 RepID=A0A8J7QAE9_9BACT|nr:peptidoglycan-binding domain-containing protein [Acanthopleuribacter pedis]MBO1320802.1 peptidoglycan-binding protein [Acanthopleuribacter pedis]